MRGQEGHTRSAVKEKAKGVLSLCKASRDALRGLEEPAVGVEVDRVPA